MTTSFSELNTYMRCPDKHHWKYTEKLTDPRWWKPAMKLGTFYHELQEARAGQAVPIRLTELTDEIIGNGHLFDEEKEGQLELLGQALQLLERWEAKYPYEEEYGWVEETIEYGGFSGTPDAVVESENGWIIRDYKTTSHVGLPLFDLQPYLYMWILHSMGEPVAGFEYDYIRTKEPAQPRLKKDGEIAYLNTIDTTPEIFLQFCVDNDILWVPENRARYLELLEEEGKWIRRDFTPWHADMEPRIRVEIQNWRAMMSERKRGMNLQAYGMTACNRCQYEKICKAALQHRPINLKEHYVIEAE